MTAKKAEETAVVKKDETAVAITAEMLSGPIGGEALSSTDMTIPRVSLIQSLSEAATRQDNPIKTGNWYNELTGEDYGKEIRVTIIDAIPGFMLYDDKTPPQIVATRWKSEKVKGYNADMITDAMISSRVFKKGERQKLADAFLYQAVVNNKDLCLITLKGVGCKAARLLNTLLMLRKTQVNGKSVTLPFYAQSFKFSAKWVEDGTKKYWEPVVKVDGLTSPDLLQAFFLMAQDLAGKTVSHDVNETPVDATEERAPF